MFHLMLVLPVLAPMLTIFGVIAAVMLCMPFWVGVGLQAVLTAVTEKRKMLCLPAVLGGVCALGYFLWLRGVVPLWFQFLYWAVFYLTLWLTWLIVDKLKAWVLRRMGRK